MTTCNPPGAVPNCFDTSLPCDTLCPEDNCVPACHNTCLSRIKITPSTARLCFNVGYMGLCNGRPDPTDWTMVLSKKGSCTKLLQYIGFEFDLNGYLCFVLDSLILQLDQTKRYVAEIRNCGYVCGCFEIYFEKCSAQLASVIYGNSGMCADTNPSPVCEQKRVVSSCSINSPSTVDCD